MAQLDFLLVLCGCDDFLGLFFSPIYFPWDPSQLVRFQAALPSDAGGARPSPRVLMWKKGH